MAAGELQPRQHPRLTRAARGTKPALTGTADFSRPPILALLPQTYWSSRNSGRWDDFWGLVYQQRLEGGGHPEASAGRGSPRHAARPPLKGVFILPRGAEGRI